MEAQTAVSSGSKSPEPATEKDAAVKLKPLRDGIKEIENAYELMRASRAAFREKVAAVAEKSGVEPSVIRAFVAARMMDDSERAGRKVESARQLAMVFEEVGI